MLSVRDLSAANKEDITAFLDSFDTVLADCDGVLWTGKSPIPGSKDVINKLKDLGKKVFFVSNNSTITLEEYLKRFTLLGYHTQEGDIITPAVVIATYLKAQNFDKKAFVLGSKAFKHTLTAKGIQCVDFETEVVEESINGFIQHLENLRTDIGCVIVDSDPQVNYLKLMQAVTLLKRNDCLFVVGATDHHFPLTKDIILIGPGYFVSILETATQRKPIKAGKPSPLVAEVISMQYPLDPGRTLIIGDSVIQDMLLGTRCGFHTLLVLSGITTLQQALEDSEKQPQYFLQALGDLLPLLDGCN